MAATLSRTMAPALTARHKTSRACSASRPLVSTKLLRLPTRGALGNGLRVIAGAVLASNGTLVVTTRNQRIRLRPEHRDGTTTVVSVKPVKYPVGTRIEISFGSAYRTMPTRSAGRASPRKWFAARPTAASHRRGDDAAQFHELLSASGNVPVRELVANLDGCTGGRAGENRRQARLGRMFCAKCQPPQPETLLKIARENAKPVTPKRLGAVGPLPVYPAYATASGDVSFGTGEQRADVPLVVEAWARKRRTMDITVCVNRTPVAGDIDADHNGQRINLFGCGLQGYAVATAPKKRTLTSG